MLLNLMLLKKNQIFQRAEKLQLKGSDSLLSDLNMTVKKHLLSSPDKVGRPDLLRTKNSDEVIYVEFRSLKKIAWMEKRLIDQSFTSFWP